MIVGLLDTGLLSAVALGGDGGSSLLRSLPFFAAGNACVAALLTVAHGRIVRAWADRAAGRTF